MEPLDNTTQLEYNFSVNELSEETPVGWSSTCLDQTINYYIEWNSTHFEDRKNIDNMDKS